MATIYKGTVLKFDKQSSWEEGPLKPSKHIYTGDLATITGLLTAALNNLSGVAPGESFQIVITAEEGN